MSIPEYIISLATKYSKGNKALFDAFVAGFKAARKQNVKDVQPKDPELFEDCWNAYGKVGSREESFAKWCALTDDERRAVLPHIRAYVSTRNKEFQKGFQSYLYKKTFLDIVVARGGIVVYDPAKTMKDDYHPLTDMFQTWNEERNCLMFNGDIDNLNDGYTDANRPDGAMVAWGMYSWKWNKVKREWIKQ